MVPLQSALNGALNDELNAELPLERVAEVATTTRGGVPFVFTAAWSFTPNEAHRTPLFGVSRTSRRCREALALSLSLSSAVRETRNSERPE